MTVRFEFDLSDEEAQALFDIVDRVADEARLKSDPDDNDLPWAVQAWWSGHLKFLQELKPKPLNTRVPDAIPEEDT